MAMRTFWLPLLVSALALAPASVAQDVSQAPLAAPNEPGLMPLPADFQARADNFPINASFSLAFTGYREARLERAGERFLADLSRQTGIRMSAAPADASKPTLTIHTGQPSKEVQEPGEDESYTLEVSASGVKLDAPNPLGILHGLRTLLQLVQMTPSGFAIEGASIHDRPRFPWRGLLIDVSRHFIPLAVIKRNLDGMEAVKLNLLHLHLSDDQGFRVESRRFPKLQQMGSDGLYFTQDEIRDLIAYARDRGIRVVPEFDMPGHSTSWFVGYPELASGPGPYATGGPWGVQDAAMDPANERTYKFLDGFIGEMAHLFPDPYFHIGGDEVNGKQWDKNTEIQKFMRDRGIPGNAALQTYFTGRVREILGRHGKTMIGWDEILSPDLPKSAVIQSWRGPESLAQAAKLGYRGMLSSGYYLDLMQTASDHYAVDPLGADAAALNPDQARLILGGEACLWSEYVSPENIDGQAWPRLAAIAERLWSAADVRDVKSMYRRLDRVSWQLDFLGLTHNSGYPPMLHRIAGGSDISALRVLADVVIPVRAWDRYGLLETKPTNTTPLTSLADAVRPESKTARVFSDLVGEFLAAGSNDAKLEARIRRQLTIWRENDANLQPLLQQSFLLNGVAPLSQDLSALGAAGLDALAYLDAGAHPPDAWLAEQKALVARCQKPRALLLIMAAPAVQKLLDAASDNNKAKAPAAK